MTDDDTKALVYARTAIEDACRIIETGDQRLLANDGPAGGQPPALTLAEWRRLYDTLDKARRRLWRVAAKNAEEAQRAEAWRKADAECKCDADVHDNDCPVTALRCSEAP